MIADLDVINEMRESGGSFVKALAEAASRVDHVNLAIVKSSWPSYWTIYSERANRKQRDINDNTTET